MKEALGGLSKEVIVSKSENNREHMSDIFFLIFGKDNNIIKIKHSIHIKKIIEDIIDNILKRGRSIGGPKWNKKLLITAIFASKTCQVFITFLDSEQVICTMHINLGEDRRTIEYSENLIHRRSGILVLPSNIIESGVINTKQRPPSFFLTQRTGAPVEEDLVQTKHFSNLSKM
ncbi:hypothetical protein O181_016124 [Austropuccinia psidii MF-1]|uniref:Uncharacterized protein n=1 Tax=Austropuccinia psidii MF-1 TaxID=1389203 RepID=A0A9Q3GRH4_9BASI|nr:hypothetical protein [Austropuccinia psidii MF-1]